MGLFVAPLSAGSVYPPIQSRNESCSFLVAFPHAFLRMSSGVSLAASAFAMSGGTAYRRQSNDDESADEQQP